MSEYDQYLRMLFYKMPHSPDITDAKIINDQFLRQLSRDNGLEVYSKIKESIRWSIKNPDYNFKAIYDDLPHSNKEIYMFLKNVINKIQG